MPVSSIFAAITVFWLLSELALARWRRVRTQNDSRRDEGSLWLLVAVLGTSSLIALTARFPESTLVPVRSSSAAAAALGLLLGGLIFRWSAMAVLGRYFTTEVSIQRGHRLVQIGPYRFLRHPSYSGTLIIMLALGISTGSWLGMLLTVLPSAASLMHRIAIEERALVEVFGAEYRSYQNRSYRMIPLLF